MEQDRRSDQALGRLGDDASDEGPAPEGFDGLAGGTDVTQPRPGESAPASAPDAKYRLAKAIAVYTLVRAGIMAVLTVALVLIVPGMPLIVALAFAVVLQLPIAVLLFRGPRRELTAALAQSRARHHAERDRLRAELMGERPQDG